METSKHKAYRKEVRKARCVQVAPGAEQGRLQNCRREREKKKITSERGERASRSRTGVLLISVPCCPKKIGGRRSIADHEAGVGMGDDCDRLGWRKRSEQKFAARSGQKKPFVASAFSAFSRTTEDPSFSFLFCRELLCVACCLGVVALLSKLVFLMSNENHSFHFLRRASLRVQVWRS